MGSSPPPRGQATGFWGTNSGSQLMNNSGTVTNNYNYPTIPHPAPTQVDSAVSLPGDREGFCPFRRNLDDFVPRPEITDVLKSLLARDRDASRAALVGITGSGKTELAVQIAYEANDDGVWVFWIEGSSWRTVIRDFEGIAEQVHAPGWDDPNANKSIIVSRWLSSAPKGQWLVVIDGINDVSSLSGPSAESLIHLLPQSRKGRVLVTTENAAVGRAITGTSKSLVFVGEMDAEQAVTLLDSRIRPDISRGLLYDPQQLGPRYICTELNCLPLAICQAAAYIDRQDAATAFTKCKDLVRLRKTALLEEEDDNHMRRYHGAGSRSIMHSLQRTLNRIFATRQSAIEILCLTSLYGSVPVPLQAIKPMTDLDTRLWRLEPPGILIQESFPPLTAHSNPGSFQLDLTFLFENFLIAGSAQQEGVIALHIVQLAVAQWMEYRGMREQMEQLLLFRLAMATTMDSLFRCPPWLTPDLLDVLFAHRYSGKFYIAERGALMTTLYVMAQAEERSDLTARIASILSKEGGRGWAEVEYERKDVNKLWVQWRLLGGYSEERIKVINKAFEDLQKAWRKAGYNSGNWAK